jgi:hypothetical protein
MLPSFVNLTALPTTFRAVCISRFSSPTTNSGISGDKLSETWSFFKDVIGFTKFTTCTPPNHYRQINQIENLEK